MGKAPSRTFFVLRVSILLGILAIILLWAWNDKRRRVARTEWQRPLNVALVLMTQGDVQPASIDKLSARVRDLEAHLAAEMQIHRPGAGQPPFVFQLYGPVAVTGAPPAPAGDGVTDLVRHAYDSWQYTRGIDSAVDLPWRAFDARLYLLLRPPANEERKSVEGQSEQGGWVGSVQVELDESMVDFALFVATHELFHVLGATDKYDATGRAMVPIGLADPARQPLFPQLRAEVMARNVALGGGQERPPDALAELAVGEQTAAEIGWR